MKPSLSVTFVLLLSACGALSLQTADVRQIALIVIERHDRYADADALQESAELRSLLEVDGDVDPAMRVLLQQVATRHDMYVATDDTIGPIRKESMMNTTAILRSMIEDQHERERR